MNQGQKIDKIASDISNIKTDVYDIKAAMHNNPKTGQKGHINRLNDLEHTVDGILTTDKVRMGKVAIAGSSATIAFYYIGKVLFKLLF
jgi:hypothetical protein